MAEKKSPPITVMAKGAPIAPAYSVSPIANGSMAAIVVMEVIRMGRIRDIPAVINALVPAVSPFTQNVGVIYQNDSVIDDYSQQNKEPCQCIRIHQTVARKQ